MNFKKAVLDEVPVKEFIIMVIRMFNEVKDVMSKVLNELKENKNKQIK